MNKFVLIIASVLLLGCVGKSKDLVIYENKDENLITTKARIIR